MSDLTPQQLLEAWNAQQTAFIEFRDLRTRCLAETLRRVADERKEPLRVLDLGCGPGSVSNAVCAALPDAYVTAVDRDPVLLRLLRESTPYADRITVVDADLRDPQWADGFQPGAFDAAVSATALHWLQPHELSALYVELGRVIAPGGVVIDADHLGFHDASQPWCARYAQDYRDAAHERLTAAGAMGWDEWWQHALAMPGWEAEAAEYHRRWAAKTTVIKVSVGFHREALEAAGFSETAQLWQWLDDRIVFGRKPEA